VEQLARQQSIFEGVTRYHWMVLIIASCGWLFDCMDQRIFILARFPAMEELLGAEAARETIMNYGGWSTTFLILGWATGGIIFGMMSDKIGRVKTMIATLLIYSGFTGLSALSISWVDFFIYRFLVGLGVGGMFGAATTLIAETVPSNFRSVALGSLQALSATGNILGSYISKWIEPELMVSFFGISMSGWRAIFLVGILPSLLVIPIITILREPEAWKKAKETADRGESTKQMGTISDLFKKNPWRRHTMVGLGLGVAGMIGLWGIGFFSPELIETALSDKPLIVEDLVQVEEGKKVADYPAGSYPLVIRLRDAQDPFSQRVKEQLPEADRQWLSEYNETVALSVEQKMALLDPLNTMLMGDCIYQPELFVNIELTEQTQNRVAILQEGPDLVRLNRALLEQVYPDEIRKIKKYVSDVKSNGTMLQDVGSFFGMVAFTLIATLLSRRLAFLISFILCLVVTIFVYNSLNSEFDAYWMLPMMGFCQLALFAGYSIYFPELFPTRFRGTGVGFCYNTVRYLAAPAPGILGSLGAALATMNFSAPFRVAAMIMASIYVLGMVALIWAPETKDKPLPEEV
jgi:MFS family permease